VKGKVGGVSVNVVGVDAVRLVAAASCDDTVEGTCLKSSSLILSVFSVSLSILFSFPIWFSFPFKKCVGIGGLVMAEAVWEFRRASRFCRNSDNCAIFSRNTEVSGEIVIPSCNSRSLSRK